MLLFSRFWFVVKDVEVAVADLQEVDVTGDDVGLERQVKTPGAVVGNILGCEEDRDLDRNGHRVIDEHEALQGLVAIFVRWSGWKGQRCHARRVVFLSCDRWFDVSGEGRGAVL